MAVIGDEDTSVLRNLQPVRFAVILGHKLKFARGRNAKDPTIGDIDDVEIAVPVERRALDE